MDVSLNSTKKPYLGTIYAIQEGEIAMPLGPQEMMQAIQLNLKKKTGKTLDSYQRWMGR